ncbi:zinc finger protein 267-like [Gigantopelta aegis]|uniref:zinc finger protein 267-like n=1 Tax=Gigantopelta aegis TaxID=1735272 RepID=UPI001B88BADC|nr:zinc finger protein 267-like [Gigantopelta aegis]
MPDELPDYGQEGKSFIVVLPQTLVQFNAILVETSLSADDQLQQFFQIYQCIKTTLTVNRPKKTLSNLHYFLSQLEEFKKYMLTFTKKPKGFVSSSSQSVHRHTRSEARKHLTITYIPKTPTADSSSVHTENDSLCNNAAGNTSDDDELESPKKNQDNSFLSTLDDGSPDKADDTNPEESTNQTSCLSETVKATQKCSVTNETRSNIHDKTFKRLSHKKKVSKELPTECLTEEKPPVSANEKREKKTHILSIKNKEKQKRKMVTSIESDGSTTSKQVVEKANYMKHLGKYRCSLCSYCTTRKYDINTHCQKHKQRSYTCKDCVITFETRQALQRHLNLNHKQQAFAFPCPVCSNVFGYKSELEEHMLDHPGSWLHHCPKCDKGFSKQEYLTQHLKRCGRQRFTENNEYGKQGKLFFCKLCSYKTEWSTSIKRHRFTHTVVGKPTCEICSKSYCCEGDLRDHMNVAHSNAKFLCYQCGKEFSCRSSLLRHTQVTHELRYKYKCEVCSQQFTDRRKMADHMDKHTGARNHVCHICGMAYRYRPRLAVHLRRHQNPEPLQCEYCKKTFKNSDTLRVHIMGKHLDRKYPCPYCGKDFIWHKSMSHHKKRCRSRPPDFSSEDTELKVDAPLPQAARPNEDEEEMLDERMATDMVIQAAAEAIKAEAPPTSNPWKVYRIPTYSSNAHAEITVSNLSGLPISNLSSIPMSHLPNISLNSTSVSNFINLSDVSGSNIHVSVQGLSSLPVATFSNLHVSSIAEQPVVGIPNGQTATTSNLTMSNLSNLPVSTMSNETITTLSNVPVSSLSSVPIHMSNLSKVPVTNVSHMHMSLTQPSLNNIVNDGLPNEWKVDSTQVPVYVKDY